MRRKSKFIMILFVCMVAMLAGCGQSKKEPDDYATEKKQIVIIHVTGMVR